MKNFSTVRKSIGWFLLLNGFILFLFASVSLADVDLVAQSINWDPNPANEGDAVSITFTVRNNGPEDVYQDFHVQLKRDGGNMCDWMVWGGLAVGGEFSKTCSGNYGIPSMQSSGHTIELIADDTNQVTEQNRNNNYHSTVISVSNSSGSGGGNGDVVGGDGSEGGSSGGGNGAGGQNIDLAAKSMKWISSNPADPTVINQGDSVSIEFTVHNEGPDSANSPFHVLLTNNGTKMCDWTVTSLAVGDDFTRICSGNWGIVSAGPTNHVIKMMVDDTKLMSDQNRGNNELTVTIPVGGGSSGSGSSSSGSSGGGGGSGTVCGNGVCEAGEDVQTCSGDCGVTPNPRQGTCGNGSCESGEDSNNCSVDCLGRVSDTGIPGTIEGTLIVGIGENLEQQREETTYILQADDGNFGSFVFRAKILGSEVHNADESSAKSSAGFDSRTPFVLNV